MTTMARVSMMTTNMQELASPSLHPGDILVPETPPPNDDTPLVSISKKKKDKRRRRKAHWKKRKEESLSLQEIFPCLNCGRIGHWISRCPYACRFCGVTDCNKQHRFLPI
jgi:hypothetical protein